MTESEHILSMDAKNASGKSWQTIALRILEWYFDGSDIRFGTEQTIKELNHLPIGRNSLRDDIRICGLPGDTEDGRILLVNYLGDPTSSLIRKLADMLTEEIPAYPNHIPIMLLLAGVWRNVPRAISRAEAAIDREHFLCVFDGFDGLMSWAYYMRRHLLGLEPNPDNRVSEPILIEYIHKGMNGTCIQPSLWEATK